jgi:hypothetical protein
LRADGHPGDVEAADVLVCGRELLAAPTSMD